MHYGALVLLLLGLLPHDGSISNKRRNFYRFSMDKYHDGDIDRANPSKIREVATCGCALIGVIIVTTVILCILFTFSLLITGKLAP